MSDKSVAGLRELVGDLYVIADGLWSTNAMRGREVRACAKRLEQALAGEGERLSGKPFMYGIQQPDGDAYMDESCVSPDAESLENDVVASLNDEVDEGETKYKVVPLYLAPQPSAPPAGEQHEVSTATGNVVFDNPMRTTASAHPAGEPTPLSQEDIDWMNTPMGPLPAPSVPPAVALRDLMAYQAELGTARAAGRLQPSTPPTGEQNECESTAGKTVEAGTREIVAPDSPQFSSTDQERARAFVNHFETRVTGLSPEPEDETKRDLIDAIAAEFAAVRETGRLAGMEGTKEWWQSPVEPVERLVQCPRCQHQFFTTANKIRCPQCGQCECAAVTQRKGDDK